MSDHRPVAALPPVALEKARHYAVAAATVPDQRAARREHTRKFTNDACIILRIEKKSERGEQVYHRVEATGPFGGKGAHIATHIPEPVARSAALGFLQKIGGIIEPRHIEAGFRQEMGMAPLPAWNVEHSRSDGQRQQIE